MTELETHPYNDKLEPIPQGTRLLIIGTAPPPRFSKSSSSLIEPRRSLDVEFYYGSYDNQLWSEIFSALFNRTFSNRKDMIEFLKDHKMWMVDILQEYRRRKEGALDVDLLPEIFADLRSIFVGHSTIDTIVFTGGAAEKWTRDQLAKQKLIRPGSPWSKQKMPRRHLFKIDLHGEGRQIVAYTLPSPSNSTFRTHGLPAKIDIYRIIRECCCD